MASIATYIESTSETGLQVRFGNAIMTIGTLTSGDFPPATSLSYLLYDSFRAAAVLGGISITLDSNQIGTSKIISAGTTFVSTLHTSFRER